MMQNVTEALSGEFTCEVTIASTYESVFSNSTLYVYGKDIFKIFQIFFN